MTASERRRAIIEALCERRYETRENLAFEFNVTSRTITHDILMLSIDYPIYTSGGKGGGIYVAEGYRLDGRYMTEKQTKLLRRLSKNLDGEDLEELKSVIRAFGARTKK